MPGLTAGRFGVRHVDDLPRTVYTVYKLRYAEMRPRAPGGEPPTAAYKPLAPVTTKNMKEEAHMRLRFKRLMSVLLTLALLLPLMVFAETPLPCWWTGKPA